MLLNVCGDTETERVSHNFYLSRSHTGIDPVCRKRAFIAGIDQQCDEKSSALPTELPCPRGRDKKKLGDGEREREREREGGGRERLEEKDNA